MPWFNALVMVNKSDEHIDMTSIIKKERCLHISQMTANACFTDHLRVVWSGYMAKK